MIHGCNIFLSRLSFHLKEIYITSRFPHLSFLFFYFRFNLRHSIEGVAFSFPLVPPTRALICPVTDSPPSSLVGSSPFPGFSWRFHHNFLFFFSFSSSSSSSFPFLDPFHYIVFPFYLHPPCGSRVASFCSLTPYSSSSDDTQFTLSQLRSCLSVYILSLIYHYFTIRIPFIEKVLA